MINVMADRNNFPIKAFMKYLFAKYFFLDISLINNVFMPKSDNIIVSIENANAKVNLPNDTTPSNLAAYTIRINKNALEIISADPKAIIFLEILLITITYAK